jgi:DNA-binding NtrC family response regulator
MSVRRQGEEVTTADVRRPRSTPAEVVAVRVHRRGEEPLVLSLAKRQRSTLLIGRGDGVECRLADESVSRIHGFLRGDDDAWVYVDVGSANGSYLMEGGQRLPLRPGIPQPLVVGTDIHLARDNRLEPLAALPASRVNAGTRSAAGLEFEGHLQSLAPSRLPVFLLGPSGAGKTWAARTLHELGRPGRPFVALNCARLPTDPVQLQSTLIGHVKGAFTGALSDHDGAFLAARGGTLFLDEVESLSPTAQGFLLDLLEESGQLRRLGSQTVVRPEVRIVSACKTELRRTSLRHDLSHRLASGELVRVPRLAERRDDIPGLVMGFARARDDEDEVTFTPRAMQALITAPWRGEVRELESSVRLLADRARRTGTGTGVVDIDDVQRRLRDLDEAHGIEPARITHDAADDDETRQDLRRPPTTLLSFADAGPALDRNPRRLGRDDIVAALQATGGNIEHAARRLGVARNTLTKKMDDFGVQRPSRR